MILILTCNNCRKTSAVTAVIDNVNYPERGVLLLWGCPHCDKQHQWMVPHGGNLQDTARQSLKSSTAYSKSGKRADVYRRLSEAPPELHRKILFGELIWWWREEAGITQSKAAASAGLTARHWIRIEAGESTPLEENLEKVVRAAHGVMDQAYLLTDSDKIFGGELERRIAEAEERISPDAFFQKAPEGYAPPPWESRDVEVALQALRRALSFNADENQFLFYAHMVHQEYWSRRLGGPIRIGDDKAEIIPVIKKLIDLFARCENKQAEYRIINLIVNEAKFFIRKPLLVDLVTNFIHSSFTSMAGEDDTRSRVGAEWNQLTPMEKLGLTIFDLIDPKIQPHFIKACQKLEGTAKGIDHWIPE
jgi:transcriptional regulator with XRE-family HTH domain